MVLLSITESGDDHQKKMVVKHEVVTAVGGSGREDGKVRVMGRRKDLLNWGFSIWGILRLCRLQLLWVYWRDYWRRKPTGLCWKCLEMEMCSLLMRISRWLRRNLVINLQQICRQGWRNLSGGILVTTLILAARREATSESSTGCLIRSIWIVLLILMIFLPFTFLCTFLFFVYLKKILSYKEETRILRGREVPWLLGIVSRIFLFCYQK